MKAQKTATRRSGIKIMASLITLLGSLAYIMVLAVFNGCLGYVCSIGVTVMGAVGIAKALGESIALSYGWIIGLAVGFGILRGLLRYLEQYSNHYIAFRLLAVLRDKIFAALRILCPAKLESKQKGSIIAMITSDIETLEVFYAHTISPVCIAVLVSLGVFLFVGFISSWYLALIALLGYICIGIIVPLISSKKLKQSGVNYRREFASFNAYFLDSIKGVKDIVLNNAEEEREQEVNRRSDVLLKETKKMKHDTSAAQAATELTITLFIAVTLIAGILLVNYDMLTKGRMVIGVVAVFSSFGSVSAVSALPGNLTNICIQAKKGEIGRTEGARGGGKSPFLKLLLRFWQKDGGTVCYNGIDVDSINSLSLTKNVSMVSQSTYLFDMSIEDNLRIAKKDATQEELEQACKMASVHDFIATLPQGYKTQAGALGDNLSAGEKQRIGLARAFLSGSSLILLDEPTSNVDSINEGIILKALAEQKNKKSIILVSHRESTMAIADRIYRVENGNMEEVK